MNLKLWLSHHFSFAFERFSTFMARRWKRKFYMYLATFFTLFALMDTLFLHLSSEIRTAAFDTMVSNRLLPPKPDADIIIVDINESSLSAMSEKHGRWPWPREVLGDFVTQIEKQHPKAIVFDILFSDADKQNPTSDAAFDASIAQTNNTYFPMLMLGETGDDLRQVKLADIPGVVPASEELQTADATINLILPYFKSAIEGGRLGTQNVILDSDGVVRNYPVDMYAYGWLIPSLPHRLGREFGWTQPSTDHMLLNWRGKPYSYQYVSFADIYDDLHRTEKTRPADEFKDKIILIGSTAPNLYDVRATPMDKMHPGVEVLATAIDNYKHGDSLRFPEGQLWYLLITLTIIWLTAWAFYREDGRGNIDTLFSLSQFILIAFSFASINFGDTYINLAGPVMLGIAHFSLARLYARATDKLLEINMLRIAEQQESHSLATLLLVRFDSQRNPISVGTLETIRLALQHSGKVKKSVEVVLGDQKGMWGLFEKTIAISWLADGSNLPTESAVEEDFQAVLTALPKILKKSLLHVEGAVSLQRHQARVQGGKQAAESWRNLLAQTILKEAIVHEKQNG
jgi:CHASE2 domain-containing sensor protein